ncbi:MAG: transposase [Chloroflexi bacterium]|nr:transposase [Chloroflexota bacterium]MBU1749621.1 transposase [Chloroflexota bacterium]
MQLPIVAPAPIVTAHAEQFRDLFENRCQFRHFQNYLTGLMVLPNKSLANLTRCILDSADKTNLSRFFSEAPWFHDQVNDRRIRYLMQQTSAVRRPKAESALVLDDTLCEHGGSLFEHIARHYNHGDDTFPLAHNPVTSHYISGAVRFPVDLREYRRYEEITCWEEFAHKHFPQRVIPLKKKDRMRFHKEVDPTLLTDPEFQALHEQFRTKIDLAMELIESAIRHRLRFSVVLFDSWYLAEELVKLLQRRKKDWISILKKNRNLEVNSFVLRDAQNQPIALQGPHIAVQDLVLLLPASAYRPVKVEEKTYWAFTFTVRLPKLGKVRLVISYENADLTGTYAVLVTNRVDWTAQRVIATYLLRWPIETFYQDGKENLGLDEYLMRNAEAIGKHWCLVFVAYSFLHLDCLPPTPVEGSLPVKTIGEACRQQAQALIQKLILVAHDRLQQGQSAEEVFGYLFAKQRAIVAV